MKLLVQQINNTLTNYLGERKKILFILNNILILIEFKEKVTLGITAQFLVEALSN